MHAPRDVALWYARRLHESHCLPFPATLDALLEVCDQHGVIVSVSPGLSKGGHFWAGPDPLILVRERCPWLLSHELLHALALEAEPERGLCEEAACRAFSWLLCSGHARAARLLGAEPPNAKLAVTSSHLVDGGREAICRGKYRERPANNASLIYTWAPRPPREGGASSTAAQLRECRVRADAEGLEPARVFTDYAVPPFAAHQRQQGSILYRQAAQWRSEGVAALYVANMTRLGPSRSFRRPLIEAVEAAGLELRSLELPYWGTFYR